MIPNGVFVTAFGAALLALAVYHALTATDGLAGVVLPAIGGLFLLNLSIRRRRFGHGACAHKQIAKPEAPVA